MSAMSERTELPVRVERCETCRFWDQCDEVRGQCRRMPPIPNLAYAVLYAKDADNIDHACERTMIDTYGLWPDTDNTDWCGEWQAATSITYRKCKVCDAQMKIGAGNRIEGSEFCSAACRQKDHRNRVKQAKVMIAQGRTVDDVAAMMNTTAEIVRNWLTKAK
jgi:hypothetical protein